MFDFAERWLLELAIFASEQLQSVRKTGDVIPEKKGLALADAIMQVPMSTLTECFQLQLESGEIYDFAEAMGKKSFITPSGDIYNYMDGEWYVTINS